MEHHKTNEKTWFFRVYRGWTTTQLCGDYCINHEKDPCSTTRIECHTCFFPWLTRDLLPLLIYPLKADASGHASADEFGLCMARGKGCLSTGAGGEGFVRLRRLISTDIPGLWSPAKTNCQAKPVSLDLTFGGCTVDGSEIRRSPVDMVNITLFPTGFSTIPGGPGFLSSKVQPFPDYESSPMAIRNRGIPFSLQIRGLEKVTSGIPPPGGYIFGGFFLLAWLLRVYRGWNTTQVMWVLFHKLWNTRWWFQTFFFSPLFGEGSHFD